MLGELWTRCIWSCRLFWKTVSMLQLSGDFGEELVEETPVGERGFPVVTWCLMAVVTVVVDRIMPLTASMYRCSIAWCSVEVIIRFSVTTGLAGKRKALSIGFPVLSYRSCSSSIWWRSSSVFTETRASRSSGII